VADPLTFAARDIVVSLGAVQSDCTQGRLARPDDATRPALIVHPPPHPNADAVPSGSPSPRTLPADRSERTPLASGPLAVPSADAGKGSAHEAREALGLRHRRIHHTEGAASPGQSPKIQVVMATCPRRMPCEQPKSCDLTPQPALRLPGRPGRRCRSLRRGASLSAQPL
jgi:hypothetical protein